MDEMPPFLWGPPLHVLPQLSPPTRVTPIGDPSDETIDIYLGSKPMSAIARALEQSSTVIGLLVGHPGQHHQRPLVIVTDCIFSTNIELDDSPHFSTDALAAAHAIWQEQHPGTRIVGWFLGSPRGGDTLTSQDRLTHEQLFAQPWQIGLLIDSAENTSVVIRWDERELILSDQFYYWDMNEYGADELVSGQFLWSEDEDTVAAAVDTWSHADSYSPYSEQQPRSRRAGGWWLGVAIAFLTMIALAYAPGGFKWAERTLAQHTDELNQLKQELVRLENESVMLTQLTVQTENEIRESIRRAGAISQAQPPSSPTASTTGTDPGPVAAQSSSLMQPVTYIIQPGDTMWKISESLVGDPHAYRLLAISNEIGDPDLIFPGQRLVVPDQITTGR